MPRTPPIWKRTDSRLILAAVAVVSLPAGAAGDDGGSCTHPLFANTRHAVGNNPRSVAVGDLDGVNGPDLAVANEWGDDVSVLLNQGDGTFAAAVAYGVGNAPESVAIGDLDGVNGPDLVVANQYSDDVSVLLNQGDGTFAVAVSLPAGDGPHAVAIGDLDGVNGPDLAVACAVGNPHYVYGVSVLLSQGDGTFAAPVQYDAGTHPVSVAMGDLDGVNGLDLAVANQYSDDISVLLNHGDGTFAAAVAHDAANGPLSVAIGDLDGVNGPDLGVAYEGGWPDYEGGVSVLLNQGDGTFGAPAEYPAGDHPSSAAIGDLDGVDGPELAVANQYNDDDGVGPGGTAPGGVWVLLNLGDGTFAPAVAHGAGYRPVFVAVGDLDGVNGPDLAVANEWGDDVSVLLNDGDATFGVDVYYVVEGPSFIAVGDLDGINGADLALTECCDQVSVRLNQADGTYAPLVTYPTVSQVGETPSSVAIGDLDGVNGLDLAVAVADDLSGPYYGNVSVLLNLGDGTFADAVAYDAAWHAPLSVAIGDLDGMNGPDIAVTVSTGGVSVLLNHGDGTFATAVAYGAGVGPGSVAIGDLDGVNGPDLAVAYALGYPYSVFGVSVLLNQGDGTFAAEVHYDAGTHPVSVAIGDLDGVNGPDLAVANRFSDDVSVLLNHGDGTFAVAVAYDVGAEPESVAIGELDGANGPDLAVANSVSDDISVLLNQGDGTFAVTVPYGAGLGPSSVAIGDLDGVDGLDLAVANRGVYDDLGCGCFHGEDLWVLTNLCMVQSCPWDLDGDGNVTVGDLLQLIDSFGPCDGCPEDLNGDGVVNGKDAAELARHFGPCSEAQIRSLEHGPDHAATPLSRRR
ncbi:MAG: FG-GAP-like repeat-containing protein [Planctomycetota bacterium]|jgi:hypothetical protein